MLNKKLMLQTNVAAICLLWAGTAFSAVNVEDAKKLGTTLTPFGAEKAGNADGSIPAYEGGISPNKLPAGYKKGDDRYVDPYKDEKPLYVINAKNMATYGTNLTEGTKAMMQRYPSYSIKVFPSHRSVSYPSWVLENTVKNATTAKLAGTVMGDAIAGAAPDGLPLAGIPFPIPTNGYEVMWNHKLHFGPAVDHQASSAFLVDTGGNINSLPTVDEFFLRPWYDQTGRLRKEAFNATWGFSARISGPPAAAGTHFLNYYLPDASDGGQKVWFYTPGQRRVRAAPEFNYDIPIASYGGVLGWDELAGFVGRMDRYDFKLVGKKEMHIPYNVYGITNQISPKKALDPHHVNADAVRWEKHRVWVVDATLKPSSRHAYSRRTFYVDEDCLCIVSTESYDSSGKLWRVGNILTFPTYDIGGVNNTSWNYNDLIKGNYFVINIGMSEPGFFVKSYVSADGVEIKLTPQSVAAGSVR